MNRDPQKKAQIAVAFCFFTMIAILSLSISTKLPFAVKQHFKSLISPASVTEDITASYVLDEFFGKSVFIDINGLFARLTGKRTHNETTRLNNGMLSSDKESIETIADMQNLALAMKDLSQKLQLLDIPFLYVQAPYKMDLQEKLLPTGMKEQWNEQIDDLLAQISQHAVRSLDLRPALSGTAEQCEQTFYKTDYHWSPDGAFLAFQRIMDRMADSSGFSLHSAYASPEHWVRHEKANWFLGSFGKRVGQYYGGVDSLIWYTPGFETHMSCSIPHHREILYGDYSDAVIRTQYINDRNLYDDDPYCVYIGGNYPLYRLRNAQAPNNMRIMIIQDSFSLPLVPFLSTEFTEIDVIDPRYYTRSSILEYCSWTHPDAVMMILSPASTSNRYYSSIGSGDAVLLLQKKTRNLLSDYSVIIPAENSDYNYVELPVELIGGRDYSFSVDSLSLLSGETTGVSIIVYDYDSKSIVSEEILALDCMCFRGDTQIIFKLPGSADEDVNYKILVCAGFLEETSGIGIQYTGISVDEIS